MRFRFRPRLGFRSPPPLSSLSRPAARTGTVRPAQVGAVSDHSAAGGRSARPGCRANRTCSTSEVNKRRGGWKTTDAGRVWTPIFDDQPTGSVGALAVAPSNPDVIYVGSGEGSATAPTSRPATGVVHFEGRRQDLDEHRPS